MRPLSLACPFALHRENFPGPLCGVVPSLGKELGGMSAPSPGPGQPEGSIPWKAGSQLDRGCSLVMAVVLSRLDAGLCSYAWNVELSVPGCAAVAAWQKQGKPLLPPCILLPQALPQLCFPQPSITCFSLCHPMGGKKDPVFGWGGKWDARLKPR